MIFEELFQNFISDVPESVGYCKDRLEHYGADEADGMHICFGFAVRPFIKEAMLSGNKKTLERSAIFFEKMEVSGDPRIAEVLEQSVMEHLLAEDRELVAKYDDIWLPETKEAFRAVGQFVI